jgi:hypothetical protein
MRPAIFRAGASHRVEVIRVKHVSEELSITLRTEVERIKMS